MDRVLIQKSFRWFLSFSTAVSLCKMLFCEILGWLLQSTRHLRRWWLSRGGIRDHPEAGRERNVGKVGENGQLVRLSLLIKLCFMKSCLHCTFSFG